MTDRRILNTDVSERTLDIARRRIAARDQAHPDWCDITTAHRHVERHEPERTTPIKIAGLTVFVLGLFGVLLFATAIAGAIQAVPR